MSRTPKLYLEDIIKSIENINKYVSGLDLESFGKDQKTVDAVVRNIEIVGEAAKNLSEEYQEQYPKIPWSQIMATRNKVVHEYFGVDLEILWETIKEDLPALKKQIQKIT